MKLTYSIFRVYLFMNCFDMSFQVIWSRELKATVLTGISQALVVNSNVIPQGLTRFCFIITIITKKVDVAVPDDDVLLQQMFLCRFMITLIALVLNPLMFGLFVEFDCQL